MCRVRKYLVNGSPLNDSAGIHYDHIVRHFGNDAQIVCYEHNGRIYLLLQAAQNVQYLSLNGNIKCGSRFIRNDKSRIASKRHCYHNSLTHTARKLMRVHLINAFAVCDSDKLKHFDRALFDFFLRHLAFLMESNDLINLRTDTENRVQAGHRLLEDHRHKVSAKILHSGNRRLCNVQSLIAEIETDLTVYNLSLRTLQKLHYRKARYAFSAAGLADDTYCLSGGNIK